MLPFRCAIRFQRARNGARRLRRTFGTPQRAGRRADVEQVQRARAMPKQNQNAGTTRRRAYRVFTPLIIMPRRFLRYLLPLIIG